MRVKVKVQGNLFKQPSKALDKGIANAWDKLEPILLDYAKTHHKYQNRTGNLTASHYAKQMQQDFYIDASAYYADVVSDRHKDPWIEETFKANMNLIIKTLETEIAKELNK